jgi:diguanylate cyclase (GGDEF)-like protein/PAS domain S-box-containing protein
MNLAGTALLFLLAGLLLGYVLWGRRRSMDPGHQARSIESVFSAEEDEAVRKRNAILAKVFNLVPETLTITRIADGRFVEVNANWESLTGFTYEEGIGQTSTELGVWVVPEQRAFILDQVQREGEAFGVDATFRHKQGHLYYTKVSASVFDFQGEKYMMLAVQDVTAQRQAEADLRIAATAFESQEAMMITDATGQILRVNQAFTDITGYSSEEVLGKTPSLLKSGRHDSAFFAAMRETLRRTGTWQGEIWDRHKNGQVCPKWLTISVVKGADGQITHYVGMHTDITERKAAEQEIEHLAFYDPLTLLPNRRQLLGRLRQALVTSARSGHQGALLFIDLDNFKTINDTAGHDKGDLLLRQVGQRLAACIREGDAVARLGGDEFVVMIEDLSGSAEEAATLVEAMGEKILVALNQPYWLADEEHHSTASIGVTLFAGQGDTVDELLRRADLAMYQAKAAGRNTLRFFDPAMQVAVSSRAALEADLRQGLLRQQFFLHYQPQVDCDGGTLGAEALLRWRHPERGMVSPLEFIALAEDTGLILPLGLWVLQSACTQLVAWAGHAATADLVLAVNVSARQFRQAGFVAEVLGVLAQTGARGDRLKLELTESVVVENVGDITDKMVALKAHGIGFSMDDFGTGYSSLSYLRRLPLDQLKIDRSFVSDVLTNANDATIVKTIIALGQSLGLDVIAEGVETEGQREFLAGCLRYQGYLYSKPLEAQYFERYLRESAQRPYETSINSY